MVNLQKKKLAILKRKLTLKKVQYLPCKHEDQIKGLRKILKSKGKQVSQLKGVVRRTSSDPEYRSLSRSLRRVSKQKHRGIAEPLDHRRVRDDALGQGAMPARLQALVAQPDERAPRPLRTSARIAHQPL